MTNCPPSIHVCFVSKQAAANLLPLLDPSFAPKHVVLVVTKPMQNAAKSFEQAVREYLQDVTCEQVALENAYDVTSLENAFIELLGRFNDRKETVAINLTGGTKLMAIVAQRVAYMNETDTFYLNYESNELHYFKGDMESHERIAIHPKVPLFPYLRAYGFRHQKEKKESLSFTQNLRELCNLIIRTDSYANTIPLLNFYAMRAKDNLTITMDAKPEALEALIDLMARYNLVQPCGAKDLRFPNEASRFFVNGGWLEEFLARELSDLGLPNPLIIEKNLTLEYCEGHESKTNLSGTHNELDVVAWYNNRLYVFECKTAKLQGEDGNKVLYKLEQLASSLGSTVVPVLVSFVPLEKHVYQRAKDHQIHVLTQNNLKNNLRMSLLSIFRSTGA